MLSFTWLDELVWKFLELFNMDLSSKVAFSIHFFIYDVIKITILLSVMIFIISYVRSYFPPERTKKILEKTKGFKGYMVGAVLGVLSPFCSCSSVPIFIGLVSSGVPLGITFSFLITSPMVNEAAIIMLSNSFGLPITLIYIILGMSVGIIGGFIIDKLNVRKYIEEYVLNISVGESVILELTYKDRIKWAVGETKNILKRVFKWIVLGIAIGAVIHGWVPEGALVGIAGKDNPFAVIIATIAAVPLYSSVLGTIPIAESLIDKGMGLGTAMSFMMATVALSLPEMLLLKKVMKPKLIIIFITITTVGIIVVGYIFNFISIYI